MGILLDIKTKVSGAADLKSFIDLAKSGGRVFKEFVKEQDKMLLLAQNATVSIDQARSASMGLIDDMTLFQESQKASIAGIKMTAKQLAAASKLATQRAKVTGNYTGEFQRLMESVRKGGNESMLDFGIALKKTGNVARDQANALDAITSAAEGVTHRIDTASEGFLSLSNNISTTTDKLYEQAINISEGSVLVDALSGLTNWIGDFNRMLGENPEYFKNMGEAWKEVSSDFYSSLFSLENIQSAVAVGFENLIGRIKKAFVESYSIMLGWFRGTDAQREFNKNWAEILNWKPKIDKMSKEIGAVIDEQGKIWDKKNERSIAETKKRMDQLAKGVKGPIRIGTSGAGKDPLAKLKKQQDLIKSQLELDLRENKINLEYYYQQLTDMAREKYELYSEFVTKKEEKFARNNSKALAEKLEDFHTKQNQLLKGVYDAADAEKRQSEDAIAKKDELELERYKIMLQNRHIDKIEYEEFILNKQKEDLQYLFKKYNEKEIEQIKVEDEIQLKKIQNKVAAQEQRVAELKAKKVLDSTKKESQKRIMEIETEYTSRELSISKMDTEDGDYNLASAKLAKQEALYQESLQYFSEYMSELESLGYMDPNHPEYTEKQNEIAQFRLELLQDQLTMEDLAASKREQSLKRRQAQTDKWFKHLAYSSRLLQGAYGKMAVSIIDDQWSLQNAFKFFVQDVVKQVAVEAGAKAIFELGEGFRAVANKGKGGERASDHFAAAGVYGLVAAGSIGVGRLAKNFADDTWSSSGSNSEKTTTSMYSLSQIMERDQIEEEEMMETIKIEVEGDWATFLDFSVKQHKKRKWDGKQALAVVNN